VFFNNINCQPLEIVVSVERRTWNKDPLAMPTPAYGRPIALRALVAFLTLQLVRGFRVQPLFSQPKHSRYALTTTVVSAKKVSKQPTKSSSPNGGFGFASKLPETPAATGFTGARALRTAANGYDRLRKEYGVAAACRDVYVRSPLNSATTYWFVGKVAFNPASSTTATQAVLAQKRLILDYSKLKLRPNNFGGKYANALELWLAPGDSEMDVVQNKVSLEAVQGSASSDLPEDWNRSDVGYNPEIYIGEENEKGGLRVERDEEGHPTKPVFDVNKSL
jgi:hypothetical protein